MEVYFGGIVELRSKISVSDYPVYADLILHLLTHINLAS